MKINKNQDFKDYGDIFKEFFEGSEKRRIEEEKRRIEEKAKLKKALIKGDTTIHKFLIPALIIFALILFIGFIRR